MVDGKAFGLAMFGSLNPNAGDQEYVWPVKAVAPMRCPAGFKLHFIVKSAPAFAIGSALFTVTVIKSVLEHPFIGLVAVKVYGVVTLGLAKGAEILFADKPVAGVQV